jgi:hypothetical protein
MRGERFVVGDELPLLAQAGREVAASTAGSDAMLGPGEARLGCSFLAPLDPLMWDRGALGPLYDFEYRWEVYTPAAKRRWGYYVLPILFGDRLVGRIEPRIDRKAKSVRILSLTWERGFNPIEAPGLPAALSDALNSYLEFGEAEALVPPLGAAHRSLFRAIAERVPLGRAPTGGRSIRSGAGQDPAARDNLTRAAGSCRAGEVVAGGSAARHRRKRRWPPRRVGARIGTYSADVRSWG